MLRAKRPSQAPSAGNSAARAGARLPWQPLPLFDSVGKERGAEHLSVRNGVIAIARLEMLLSSLLATVLFSASAAAETPVLLKDVAIEYEVQRDGLYVLTFHGEIEATNSAVAARIGEVPIPFSESMEDLDIPEAYTRKADGRTLPVDTGAILPQLRPGDPQTPLFNDLRQKVIVFPDVASGDTVVWTFRRHMKQPYFPGQFTTTLLFPREDYADAQVTIRAPQSLALRVETHGLGFSRETAGDQAVYHWRFAAQGSPALEPVVLSPYDRLPRVFVSSFASYEELGRAYASLTADKIVVSPRIQALADQITAGLSDRRQQAQKIYEWVSRHIRYVAIFIGKGSLVPHDADAILVNGYGDCKDHTVLFASLLKAKGIASDIVLINLGNAYSLPTVPALADLNHAISYLPEFGIYADTTAGVAPFGVLPLEEYGKPVVHVGSSEKTVRAVPILHREQMSMTLRTVARLLPDGSVTGTTVSAATGPMSVKLRSTALAIQSIGSETAAKRLLQRDGQDGKGSFETMPVDSPTASYSVTGHFDLNPRPKTVAGDSFLPPTELALLDRPGDLLMGPLAVTDLGDAEATPCFSGNETEELSLELPPHKHVVRLPGDLQIQNTYLRYSAHWSLAGKVLTVRREFSSGIDKPLCTGKARVAAAAALKEIREDYRTTVALADD
jgi:transglutaminase-like putative cysteine protease